MTSIFSTLNSVKIMKLGETTPLNGRIHIDVYCPKCGTEITELEFNRKKSGDGFVWESFHKCPKCGTKVEWR